jgi:hypothetical protein
MLTFRGAYLKERLNSNNRDKPACGYFSPPNEDYTEIIFNSSHILCLGNEIVLMVAFFKMSSQIPASFQTHDRDTGSAPAEEPVKHRSRWLGPALFAVVSLVIIQVCVGILLKAVQEHDT